MLKKNGSPRYVARINTTANSCAIAVFGEEPNAEFKGSSDYVTAR
jgi:hypothetical protein